MTNAIGRPSGWGNKPKVVCPREPGEYVIGMSSILACGRRDDGGPGYEQSQKPEKAAAQANRLLCSSTSPTSEI
jgi:hypothetical protein